MGKVFFFFCVSSFASAAPVVVGLNQSTSLSVPGLARASVANTKIARARAVPPSTLVVTGIHVGKTTVRTWDSTGREFAHDISVLPSDNYDQMKDEEGDVVKVSLEFLELDVSLGQNFGIKWPDAIQFNSSATLQGGGDGVSGLNYTAGFSSARGLINFLVKEGWAKRLANPDLFVRLGEQAVFHSGGEIPVATSSENYGRYLKHVEWKPFGLTVKVRPQSGDRFHISSEISVEASELNQGQSLEGVPALSRRNLDTKMHSKDGETVILSGLLRQASHSTKEGVPFLSSIPLLGALFSTRNEGSEESEIFMAVTFSIATRRDQDRFSEFREKFSKAKAR